MSSLKLIKAGAANRRRIKWPGTDTDIELRVLSNAQISDASLAADTLYRKQGVSVALHNLDDWRREMTVQQLFRACVEPGTDTTVAATITEFRELCTRTEADLLVQEYSALEQEANPSPETLSEEQFDALIAEVKKKPEQTIGSISNIATLKRLASFLANQQYNLPTDSGSTST
jgi:hypothetical protein